MNAFEASKKTKQITVTCNHVSICLEHFVLTQNKRLQATQQQQDLLAVVTGSTDGMCITEEERVFLVAKGMPKLMYDVIQVSSFNNFDFLQFFYYEFYFYLNLCTIGGR